MSKKLSFLVLLCFLKFSFCFSLFFGMMPSHSSCDCAHSCMDLSQALAQVQIHQSHCFHKTKQKQREERRTDGKTDWTTAWLVKRAPRTAQGEVPGLCYDLYAASRLGTARRHGDSTQDRRCPLQQRCLLEKVGAKGAAENRMINKVRKSWPPCYQKALEPRETRMRWAQSGPQFAEQGGDHTGSLLMRGGVLGTGS